MLAAPLGIGMLGMLRWIAMLATPLWIGMLVTPLWISMLATRLWIGMLVALHLGLYPSCIPFGSVC